MICDEEAVCLWDAILSTHRTLCGDHGVAYRNVMVVVGCNGHVEESPHVTDKVISELGNLRDCEIFLLPLFDDCDMSIALLVRYCFSCTSPVVC